MATAKTADTTQDKDLDPTRLVRVIVNCNDPAKKEYSGEIFTIGNDVIGTLRKYIPFGTENGWHIPAIMVDMLKEKKTQVFSTKRNAQGEQYVEAKEIPAYTITELPPLSEKELADLKEQQLAMGLID